MPSPRPSLDETQNRDDDRTTRLDDPEPEEPPRQLPSVVKPVGRLPLLIGAAGLLLVTGGTVALGWFLWSLSQARPREVVSSQPAIKPKQPPIIPPAPTNEEARFLGHTDGVDRVAASPDGELLLSGSYDNTVRLWHVRSRSSAGVWTGHTDKVTYVAFAPKGGQALSTSGDGTIRVWDVLKGGEVKRLTGHEGIVWCAVFTPDGRRVLSGGADRTLRLWEVDSGKEVLRLTGHTREVNSVALHPNGQQALSAGWDGTVRVWDLKEGKEVRSLVGHTGQVHSVAYTPDGRQALSGGGDGTVALWDVGSGHRLHLFRYHQGAVWFVAVSADGTLVLSAGGGDRMVRLTALPQRRLLATFHGHTGGVTAAVFLADRRHFASSSQDRSVRLWSLPR
jgi:WD40 repeat protein